MGCRGTVDHNHSSTEAYVFGSRSCGGQHLPAMTRACGSQPNAAQDRDMMEAWSGAHSHASGPEMVSNASSSSS